MVQEPVEIQVITPGITLLGLKKAYSKLFYDQDWYEREWFARVPLTVGTHLFGRSISSGQQPTPEGLPSAVACGYFYVLYIVGQHADCEKMWEYEYVWTSDRDTEGNQVYVGGWNKGHKKGFQVHRHLTLKPYHTTIEYSLIPKGGKHEQANGNN